MQKSFYQFVLTLRDPDDKGEISQFANHVFYDGSFPKTSTNFEEISKYLELESDYVPTMTLFDKIWSIYQEKNQLK